VRVVRVVQVTIVIMLVREMVADDAARDRAENGVMMREVTGDGANGGALEASLGFGLACGQSRQGEYDDKACGETRHGRVIP
jgi:hypothetical protein